MTREPADYVTDVEYVRGFEPNLSPTRLRLCAALSGFQPPKADAFDYCELGCAQGDTLVALAAAFPRSRFVGVDLNAAHIEVARTVALGARVGNVRFIAGDIEEVFRDETVEGRFDYVVAHGLLSWISPQKRKAVLDVASARLEPGGLLYASYNAFPGWASIEPLRQLITASGSGDSLQRARVGLELARALAEGGADYFGKNPAARAMLARLDKMSLGYVVHEYLHAHWVPMYFAQLAAEMSERDLHFVGQLPPFLNYRDLAIPEKLQPLFRTVGDRLAFEGLKDYALNTYFRTDVFVKGRVARDETVTRDYLDTTPFGSFGDERPAAEREAKLPNHTLRFHGPVYDALLPVLKEGATTALDLLARPELASFDRARLRDAVLHLVLGGRVVPMSTTTRARAVPDAPTMASAYNRFILDRGFVPDVPVIVTSPAMGNGTSLTMVDAAGLCLALEPDRSKHATWIREFCAGLDHLVVGERRVEDKRELEALVARYAERFREERLPKLVELGVVV